MTTRPTSPRRPEPNLAALREAIRARRTELGWTLRDVADEAGLSAVAIGYLENGAREGNITSWYRVANALGIPFPDLVAHLDDSPSR